MKLERSTKEGQSQNVFEMPVKEVSIVTVDKVTTYDDTSAIAKLEVAMRQPPQ